MTFTLIDLAGFIAHLLPSTQMAQTAMQRALAAGLQPLLARSLGWRHTTPHKLLDPMLQA